jgi:hypothetical protein
MIHGIGQATVTTLPRSNPCSFRLQAEDQWLSLACDLKVEAMGSINRP